MQLLITVCPQLADSGLTVVIPITVFNDSHDCAFNFFFQIFTKLHNL